VHKSLGVKEHRVKANHPSPTRTAAPCPPAAWTDMPLDFPPGPGPPSGASLGGPTMGQIGWGGPSTGPALPFFLVQQGCLRVGVSRCGPAAVVGRGC